MPLQKEPEVLILQPRTNSTHSSRAYVFVTYVENRTMKKKSLQPPAKPKMYILFSTAKHKHKTDVTALSMYSTRDAPSKEKSY